MPSEKTVRSLLLAVFFFSGFTALVYQLVWIRLFGLVFGVSVYAISTVLTAFMTGLALGNYLFGRIVDKFKNTLSLFVLLELGMGAFALFFPLTFKLFKAGYISFHQLFPTDFYAGSLVRFVFSFLFLLIPTTLMGGTLPVLTKFFVRHLGRLGKNVGTLYSVNNLGAFTGCFVAGFLLVHILGATATILLAAFINLANALVVFLLARRQSPVNSETETDLLATEKQVEPKQPTYPALIVKLVLWVFAIEGFTTLAYEVVWSRILVGMSFDKSVYFAATVILSFIFGLFLGSWLVSFFVDRAKNLLTLLGGIEAGISLLAIGLLPIFAKIGQYLEAARPQYVSGWLAHLGREYLLFFLVMLPPIILMGMTFPIVGKIYTQNIRQLGKRIGLVGALDTAGSILGAFIAGFIFIPFLGVVKAVLLTAAINLCLGLLVFVFHPFIKTKLKILFSAALILSGLLLQITVPKQEFFHTWLTSEPEDRLLFYKEGVASTVAVPQHLDGSKDLAINGAISGQTGYGDFEVHRLEGYLPFLLQKNPKSALLIGMGMGITADCLLQPDMAFVDCVEICPEVIEAAEAAFWRENGHVVNNPKLHIFIEDGRSFLQITGKKYDIITSSGIHPRLSPNIYTKEFYRLCRDKLSENGLLCKWVPSNWLSENEFKMLLRAFVDIFPHATLWAGNAGHALLVGGLSPLNIDADVLLEKMRTEKIHADLAESLIETPAKFLAKFVCDEKALQSYLADAGANSDDNAVVEYSRYMNKARNPAIIRDLLELKHTNAASLLEKSATAPVDEADLDHYFFAEKLFIHANIVNFYGDRVREMIDALHRAIALDPQNYRFRESLAIIYYKNGYAQPALEEMLRVIELQPDNGANYENLGRIYFDGQDKIKARDMFSQAIQLDPELVMSHYYLAMLYAADKNTSSAIAELREAVGLYPNFARAHYDLGRLYFSMRNITAAKTSLERCLDIEPELVEAKQLLAKIERAIYD